MSDWGPGAWGLGRIKMRGGGGEGKRERGKEGRGGIHVGLVFGV